MNIVPLNRYDSSIIFGIEGYNPGYEKRSINKEVSQKNQVGEKEESYKKNSSVNAGELNDTENRQIELLKKADSAVRAHELAHIVAGGRYITSGARLQYQRGPDGKNYAVAGEVTIDTSPIPGDPKATADKMGVVHRAALAPKDPSAQDRRVAEQSSLMRAQALMELSMMTIKEKASPTEEPKKSGYDLSNSLYTHQGSEVKPGSVIYVEA